MPILEGSRYAKAKIYTVVRDQNGSAESRYFVSTPFRQGMEQGKHPKPLILSEALALDLLALHETGDERDWWILPLANDLLDVFNLPLGTVVSLPSKEKILEVTQ